MDVLTSGRAGRRVGQLALGLLAVGWAVHVFRGRTHIQRAEWLVACARRGTADFARRLRQRELDEVCTLCIIITRV